jgi:predicted acyl esterase
MSPSETDPTTATYEFELSEDLVMMGGAVVDLTFSADATGIPVAVRVWDVDEAGDAQALVTRGVYRVEGGAAPAEVQARFQLAPQGYRFPAGHQLKVEVTGNDSPYLQESNIAADIAVHRMSIAMPRYDEDLVAASSNEAADSSDDQGDGDRSDDSSGLSPWWLLVAVAAVCIGAALWLRRRRTRPAT